MIISRRVRGHALRRLSERYGVNLTREEYAFLCEDIQNNKTSDTLKFYRRKSKRLSLWIIKINDKLVLAYYDKDRHLIVTFPEVRNKNVMQFIFDRR